MSEHGANNPILNSSRMSNEQISWLDEETQQTANKIFIQFSEKTVALKGEQ